MKYHWQPAPAFLERHVYPKGGAPRDHHPQPFGKITSHWYGCRTDGAFCRPGGYQVVVHSTKRRDDGWSYNVAVERDYPEWVSWFHHAPTGKRIRHLSSAHPYDLARSFGLPETGTVV